MKRIILFIISSTFFLNSFSQSSLTNSKSWHLEDPFSSGIYGISIEKAYTELLKNKVPKKKIIVAVIDSGIDTAHEDLKPVLWTNKKEVPGNGKDDDNNGYIDDIHGWNFIGGKDGSNVGKDSYEAARVYYRFKSKFEAANFNTSKLSQDEIKTYRIFQKAKEQLEAQGKEAAMYVMILKDVIVKLPQADSILQVAMGKKQYTGDELQSFSSSEPSVSKARTAVLGFFQQTRQMDNTNTGLIGDLVQFYEGEKSKLDAVEKEPRRYRAEVVKDNYDDIKDRYYGNNDIMGTDASHGTHVSGIIGAVRNNNIGIKGIADNVEIMTIRAVPDGDEHDKDIANAIKYAVDNGALVVNMSFGKSFSPEKKWVDEAVRYAESKDVLMIHAAGNDSKNIDTEDTFPNMKENDDTLKLFSNWINVGASGSSKEDIIANFSNYGKREVHVFAPGVKIYSTIPEGNSYGDKDGTSMASPVVAGLASLILSYYPELSAKQVKSIIETSVVKIEEPIAIKPGTEDEKIGLNELSITGGIVNAYNALLKAESFKGERVLEPVSGKSDQKGIKKGKN
jgi:subtilisin family serine protease